MKTKRISGDRRSAGNGKSETEERAKLKGKEYLGELKRLHVELGQILAELSGVEYEEGEKVRVGAPPPEALFQSR